MASSSKQRDLNPNVSAQDYTDLLPPGAVDASTIMVLVNAAYMKGSRAKPFAPFGTVPKPFHAKNGDVTADTMQSGADTRKYAKGDGYEVVELAYEGLGCSMFIVVPELGRFDEIEAKADGDPRKG